MPRQNKKNVHDSCVGNDAPGPGEASFPIRANGKSDRSRKS